MVKGARAHKERAARPVGSPPDPAAQPARGDAQLRHPRASSRPGTGGRPQPASNSSPFALLLRNADARSTALAQQLSSTQTLFSPPRARLKPAPGTNSAGARSARPRAPLNPRHSAGHSARRRRNAGGGTLSSPTPWQNSLCSPSLHSVRSQTPYLAQPHRLIRAPKPVRLHVLCAVGAGEGRGAAGQ